jgi:hypothetical protein
MAGRLEITQGTRGKDMPSGVRGDPRIRYGPTGLPWGEQVPPGAVVTAPIEDPTNAYPRVPPPNVHGDFPRTSRGAC